MIQLHGLWWPADVGTKWRHSLKHVSSLEWAIGACRQKRTAIQAGGNIGLWPRRMASEFRNVLTFEPDAISRDCLIRNVPANVRVHAAALGAASGVCDMERASLGSHRVVSGSAVPIMTVDFLGVQDLDLLQLDVEGYEWHALMGAVDTIRRCQPVIQVELRNFTERYGKTDTDVLALLWAWGYREVSKQPGEDFVFQVAA